MAVITADPAPAAVPRPGYLHAVPDERRSPLVARRRLVRRLTAARDAAVAVVIAPAGYGKTTLLRQFELADPRPFQWLDVDAASADPDLFAAWLAHRHRSSVLVLDDVHRLESRAAVRAMQHAVRRGPAGSLLVLASRTEPDVPLGRLRADGAVVELRAGDLAMGEREGAQLLRRAGVPLGAVEVAALVRRTEGWPAGLVLASLSLAEAEDLGAALARFGGDDRFVADYLRDELLAGLSREQAAFVTHASPLDELSGPLCDAVLGQRGSGRVLRDLARANVLLVPLDRVDERFRMHGMLGDMLQAELRRAEPDRAREVHRRASAWHEREGDVDRAIEHAIAAGDADRAGELIWGVVAACGGAGRVASIDRWLASFRDAQIAARPTLALSAATGCALRGDRDAAERWANAADRLLEHARPELRRSLATGAVVVRAMLARGGLAQMGEDAARACALDAGDGGWLPLACLLAGVAHHLTGERDRARDELEEGASRAAASDPALRATCLAQLALLALEDGDFEHGADLTVRARLDAARADTSGRRTCALVFAVSAFAGAHRGDVQRARADAVDARRRLAAFADPAPWYAAEVRIALARAELRLSDAAGARKLLAEAARALRRTADATVLHAWIGDAWERADTFAAAAVAGPTSLTTAELRVLRFLPSHLSFREVAARLHVSTNTVKTQAHAVYRKLDASSRSEAVTRARDVGLIDG